MVSGYTDRHGGGGGGGEMGEGKRGFVGSGGNEGRGDWKIPSGAVVRNSGVGIGGQSQKLFLILVG